MRQLSKYLLCLNIQLLLSGTWHLISMGYKFHFAPSLGQIWFCVNFTFFFWILSQSLNHCMIYGDRDTAKEQWRSGLWDKSRSPLSAVLWVDSSEVTHGCSRSSDLEYVGKWGNFFTPLIVYLLFVRPCLTSHWPGQWGSPLGLLLLGEYQSFGAFQGSGHSIKLDQYNTSQSKFDVFSVKASVAQLDELQDCNITGI